MSDDRMHIDVRLLIAVGSSMAIGATFIPETHERAFTLLSTTSSALIGAGIGILREKYNDVVINHVEPDIDREEY